MPDEGLMQVFGVRLRDASALALDTGRRFRKFLLSLGQDGPVAFPHGLEFRLGQTLLRALADLVGGLLQEPLHASGPGMAVGVDDELEVAQQMRAAERVVAAVVGEIACPTVVNQGSAIARDDADVVHCGTASLRMAERQRQVAGTATVQPVVLSVDTDRGLVGVQDRRGEEPRRRPLLPFSQRLVQAPDPGQKGRLCDGFPEERLHGLRDPPERNHLRGHKVRRKGDDPVSILHGARHVVGKGSPGLGAAVRADLDLGLDMFRMNLEDDVR